MGGGGVTPNLWTVPARAAALQAIAKAWRGNAGTLAVLWHQATSHPDPQARAAALQVIAEAGRGDAETRAFLRGQATSHPDPQARAAAHEAVGGERGSC